MVSQAAVQGAKVGLPMVLKLAKNKIVQQGLAGLGLVESYDIVSGLFNKEEGGELGNTDPQTSDEMIKLVMTLLEEMDSGGIPLTGLKANDGTPLDTNYITIAIETGRVFPHHKYNSSKVVRAARRRGRSRGFGRAMRNTSRNKYIYS
jgi:hypothetical protein